MNTRDRDRRRSSEPALLIDSFTGLPGSDGVSAAQADAEVDSGTRFCLPDAELERMFDEACNVTLPQQIGRYRILSLLGAGGMGVVYRAEQDHPRRLVALKTLRLGIADRRLVARFENEIASLARLRHPNIAQIYDAGVASTPWGPQPFIAMELIDGPRLTDFVQRRSLSTAARLQLFARLCEAVEHAHQRGVIHRDLKPANILVVEEGTQGRRDGGTRSSDPSSSSLRPCIPVSLSAQPKILDFGVARLRHHDPTRTLATTTGEILGTLAYMSPEQVSGSPDAVDTRSDVYALGCILYELLGARPPLDLTGLSVASASQRIANDRPLPIRHCDPALKGDLEIIVAKALEKDPERRYPSALALADDVRRYLALEPILARKPSPVYIARKWVGRHRLTCILCGLAVASLFAGAIGMLAGFVRSERDRQIRQEIVTALLEGVNGIATDVLPRMTYISGTAETRRALLARLLPMRDLLRSLRGNDPRLMAAEADVLDAIASLESDFSDVNARLGARHAVLDARRRLVQAAPDDRRQMRRYAIDHVHIGDILGELRDMAGAENWYRRAFDIEAALLNAEPANVDYGINLLWSHARLAHAANRLGRADESLAHLRGAETLLRELRARTQGSEETRLLDCQQQCLALWCDYYSGAGQPAESCRVQRLRIDVLRQLTERDPSNCVYAVRAAGAIVNMAGNGVKNLGDCDAARRDLDEAEPLLDKLGRLERFNDEACEVQVNARHNAARIEAAEGRPDAALVLALQARELLFEQLDHGAYRHILTQLDESGELMVEFAAACGLGWLGEAVLDENAKLRAEAACADPGLPADGR